MNFYCNYFFSRTETWNTSGTSGPEFLAGDWRATAHLTQCFASCTCILCPTLFVPVRVWENRRRVGRLGFISARQAEIYRPIWEGCRGRKAWERSVPSSFECSPNAGEFGRVPRLLSQVNLLDGVVACLGASAVLQGLDKSEESEVQNVGVRAVRYYLYAISIQGARCQQLDIIEHTVRACVVLHYAAAVTGRPGSW